MSSRTTHRPKFVIVANRGCPRVVRFQQALEALELPPARVVTWLDVLRGQVTLPTVINPGDVVRLESPGRDFEVERTLLAWGAGEPGIDGYNQVSESVVASLTFEKGRLLYPRQWFLGFRRLLAVVRDQLAGSPPHTPVSDPAEIGVMFDKPRCHQHLSEAGIRVPGALPEVHSYSELIAEMSKRGWRRVFVKLAHGSSGSGVVAYEFSGDRHQATTTVELVRQESKARLYNTRRLRLLRSHAEIAELIDELCRHRVQVERWLPKAGLPGGAFDLRVVTINGEPCHSIGRLSRSPVTNLHLLNHRAPVELVRERMGTDSWAALEETCRNTARLFPKSLQIGIDLQISPGFRRHAVLEVNAFGDLLPGVLHMGVDTYTAQIRAVTGSNPSFA